MGITAIVFFILGFLLITLELVYGFMWHRYKEEIATHEDRKLHALELIRMELSAISAFLVALTCKIWAHL